jgi:hypothetical protein
MNVPSGAAGKLWPADEVSGPKKRKTPLVVPALAAPALAT